jgi:hypothetical protein
MVNDMLRRLPVAEQAFHLGHMVVEGCEGIRAFYMGITDNRQAIWSVGCTNGANYEVVIENDAAGTSGALDCETLKAATNIDCFATLTSQGNRPPRTSKQIMCAIARLPKPQREQAVRHFIENLEDLIRDSGEAVPNTKKQVLRKTLQQLDKYARSCDGTASDLSGVRAQPKPGRRSNTAATKSASRSAGEQPDMVSSPSECAELKAELIKLGACSGIPKDAREALWESYDHSGAARDLVPVAEAQQLAKSCALSADDVRKMLTICRPTSKTPITPAAPDAGSANELISPE